MWYNSKKLDSSTLINLEIPQKKKEVGQKNEVQEKMMDFLPASIEDNFW